MPPPLLSTDPDLLLGLDPSSARGDHTQVLRPGATVLLYTDGLVERRDAPLDQGLDLLQRTVSAFAEAPSTSSATAFSPLSGTVPRTTFAMIHSERTPKTASRLPEVGPPSASTSSPTADLR